MGKKSKTYKKGTEDLNRCSSFVSFLGCAILELEFYKTQ